MPKKSRARKSIKQQQKQQQNISIKIGELPTKKRRRRPRKGPSAPGREAPMRQLPPVVYQTLPQLTYYGRPNESGVITAEPPKPTSIVEPVKSKTSILEDIGMIGTEGPVEIIDVPTKRETLKELITPIEGPRLQVNPVETPSISALFREQKATTITQPPMQQFPITQTELPMQSSGPPTIQKRKYTKSGKYSKKGQPEPQRPISPLSFEGSFGIEPKSVYAEPSTYSSTQNMFTSPMTERSIPTQFRSNTPEESTVSTKYGARSDFSPMTDRSLPTTFRSDSPEQGFITQKDVNKFFQPRKRNTSPKPKPKPIIIGEGSTIKRRSREIL